MLGTLAALAGRAHADATDLVTRALVLPEHALAASLTVELGIDRLAPGNPLALAPSAWFGATSRLTVGVIHGHASVDRIAAGAGVCVLGDACVHPYTGGGFDGRYTVVTGRGHVAVAAHGRMLVRDVHPGKPAVTLGAVVRYQRGRFAVVSDPYVQLGLANRDLGNRAALVVPIWLAIQPSRRTLVAVHTGYDSDLAVWRDGYHVPLAVGVTVAASRHLDVGLEVGFASLLGPQVNYQAGAAQLTFGVR